MDRLRTLRTFISVAEHASFAEAGRRLSMSPTAVTRSVAALEASLGVQLLRRTTRSVRLTDEGAAFLEQCRRGLAEIDGAFERVRSGQAAPRGLLTVTAPVVFGRKHVMPIVAQVMRVHPDLQVRLLLLDRVVSLVDEGVDIAVRIAELPDSGLHALPLGEVRWVLSASPTYLAARGRPRTLADLREHDVIGVEDEAGPHRGWALDAVRRAGRPAGRLSVNHVDAAVAAALAGLGVVRTLSYQVAEEVAAGRLEVVLPAEGGPAVPISLLFQAGRRDHPNVRAFIAAARSQWREVQP